MEAFESIRAEREKVKSKTHEESKNIYGYAKKLLPCLFT